MDKNIDELLKQKMSIDVFDAAQTIPTLKQETLNKIKIRKKETNALPVNPIAIFFNRFKAISTGLATVIIVITINFVCTLNIETNQGVSVTKGQDTTLTVASNTYLATLNQFTMGEIPVNTTTALTSISTFINRN